MHLFESRRKKNQELENEDKWKEYLLIITSLGGEIRTSIIGLEAVVYEKYLNFY